MRSVVILATAGLLTATVAATVGEAAAAKALLLPALDGQPLLRVADRPKMPGTTSPPGRPSGPGMGIVIPFLAPGLSEIPINKEKPGPRVSKPKAKIPAPVHCVEPYKTSWPIKITPMSELKVCFKKGCVSKVNSFGHWSNPEYCISCNYVVGGFFKHSDFYISNVGKSLEEAKKISCWKCKDNYQWNCAKQKCCDGPNQ